MNAPSETLPFSSDSNRRDTMSTINSDKQPSLPSGRWPLTIHGNCARCGHHHKAAVIHIHVVEGICEGSPLICDRCGQKWLTIGGVNSTQISLLSTVTTELDLTEINFRYTLFSMVRSAASIASPTALANVPEDPSPTPSRNSSTRYDCELFDNSPNVERRMPRNYHINLAPGSEVERKSAQVLDKRHRGQDLSPRLPQSIGPTLRSIKSKVKNTINVFRKVGAKAFSHKSEEPKWTAQSERRQLNTGIGTQRQLKPPEVVASVSLENGGRSKHAEDVNGGTVKTTKQIIEDLKSVDKQVIRNMNPKQRDLWIREHITTFKRSLCCSSLQCDCKRRHSTSSISDYHSLLPHCSATATPTFQHYSLGQMGSQFDGIPAGALFTHTGPLTISATRISEADTAVENQEGPSSPRSSQYARRSRSPRPASLFRPRVSWQQSGHAGTHRDSMESVLAVTVRNSWRGWDRLSHPSVNPEGVELPSSTDVMVEEEVSVTPQRFEGQV
jgi:hypothetical protein